MKQILKSTLNNFWFWASVVFFIDSLIRVHNVIHYTWIDGLVNLSEGILLNADTMRSEKPHKYR